MRKKSVGVVVLGSIIPILIIVLPALNSSKMFLGCVLVLAIACQVLASRITDKNQERMYILSGSISGAMAVVVLCFIIKNWWFLLMSPVFLLIFILEYKFCLFSKSDQ